MSRMTLHRREITIPRVLAGLTLGAGVALREAFWPVLVADGTGAERLEQALVALCAVADDHLPLLAGLYSADGGLFHDAPSTDGTVATRAALIAPLAKLLRDGAADGSLRQMDDPDHTAAVLFNTLGWAYVHLRHSQHWPPGPTREHLLDLVLRGLQKPGRKDRDLPR